MSASAIGTNGLLAALIASTICVPMPDAQMPWILSYSPLAMKSLVSWVAVVGSQPVNTPSAFGTTLMSGYSLSAFLKPMSRSVSAGWPARPRVYQTVPLPPSCSNSHVAPSSAYLIWLLYRLQVFGSVT